MSWQYLSYSLTDKAFGYGNGDRFKLNQIRSICCGDTSNNSEFSMPTHFGTHIDFPYHFSDTGKKSCAYKAQDFVFSTVAITVINEDAVITDYLIRNKHLNLSEIPTDTELLFIKTGFTYKRYDSVYWEKGYGFHPETADYLKTSFPNLKAIAFDLISLNTYQNRPIGREAHKAFLVKNDILIIEDVDLRNVQPTTKISRAIVACLQLAEADGAPCTILAEIYED